jgi:hypothetical protein
MSERTRIRLGIAAFAMLLAIGLGTLRWSGIDDRLFRILAICGALLVVLLFMTYRVFAGIADDATRAAAAEKAAEDTSEGTP